MLLLLILNIVTSNGIAYHYLFLTLWVTNVIVYNRFMDRHRMYLKCKQDYELDCVIHRYTINTCFNISIHKSLIQLLL